jgi:sulfatase maturation enzyme AslB (radical SAM superfamily)
MPFIHQNIKQEGKVAACWRYPDRIGDYRSQTLPEIWNSEQTRELRRALLNNERPQGCRSCWDFEDSGVASTRQTCNETYEQTYKIDFEEVLSKVNEDYSMPYEPQSIEIRFDNTCNLRCRHCSPTYSSQWEVLAFKDPEVKEFFVKWGAGRLEKKHISLPERSFEEFKTAIPYLKEVLIAGGEPLQQKRHWEMIEAMAPYAHNITLSYNSNLTALGIGFYNVLDHWPKFKKIALRVSIDGDDKTFGYFRTNGDIDKVIANVQKLHSLKNVEMSLTTTVSIYNITRLVDIVKFVNAAGGLFHTSIVQYPRAINPKVLPKSIKDKITQEWNDFKQTLDTDQSLWQHEQWQDPKLVNQQKRRIIRYGDYAVEYMNAEDYSADLKDTAEFIKFMDKYADTKFEEVYPEMYAIANTGGSDFK